MPPEKKTITFIAAEPRTFGDNGKAWEIGFADGTKGEAYAEGLVTFLRDKLNTEVELEITLGKEYQGVRKQQIKGAAGYEAPKGRSGRQFTPTDHFAESASSAPTMVLAFVKDLVVAGKAELEQIDELAEFHFVKALERIARAKAQFGFTSSSQEQKSSTPPRVAAPPKVSQEPQTQKAEGDIDMDKDLQRLAILAGELDWDDEQRHQQAGVSSFKELIDPKARKELVSAWQRLVNTKRKEEARKHQPCKKDVDGRPCVLVKGHWGDCDSNPEGEFAVASSG